MDAAGPQSLEPWCTPPYLDALPMRHGQRTNAGGKCLPFLDGQETMNRQARHPNAKLMVSRRGILLSSATLLASGIITSICPGLSLATVDVDTGTQSQFMRLSNMLVNHQLDPDIGARVVATAAAQHKDLPAMIDAIIAIAEKKQAAVVEDFFADIPDGELKDFAHWVIFAWYSGCSSDKRDAAVFAYEQALTFKTTSDVVTIPSYGISGPDRWSQVTVPLVDMPRF